VRFSCPFFIEYGITSEGYKPSHDAEQTNRILVASYPCRLAPSRFGLETSPMLSAAIAYQVLRQENPQTITKVAAGLEKHPWYANQWQARLQNVPAADRDMALFMQAPGGPMMFD
jgi:hypothetical protein